VILGCSAQGSQDGGTDASGVRIIRFRFFCPLKGGSESESGTDSENRENRFGIMESFGLNNYFHPRLVKRDDWL